MTVQPYDERPPRDRNFVARLSLQQIDRDIFTGWCHAGSPLRAFGGQVAGQALVAAGSTVEQPGRTVHSLHGYFLRPGRTEDHIIYMVDRLRDGKSFSTRRVRAVQYGETIFAMSASYSDELRGPEHQLHDGWLDHLVDPETLPRVRILDEVRSQADSVGGLRAAGFPAERFVDLRLVSPEVVTELTNGHSDRMAWVRCTESLGEHPLAHQCALTYFSDLSLVSTVLDHHGGRDGTEDLATASLDHAMWFHRPFRADEWLLFVTDSPTSAGGHGFARGSFYTTTGVMVASAAQEVLLRE